MRTVTPLRLAVVYLLFVIFLLVRNNSQPSIIGWAYTFGTGILIFAFIVLFVDWLLMRIKNNAIFWMAQVFISLLLLMLFIYLGLPGRL